MTQHTSKEQETCPFCGGDAGNNWFDRSLCPCAETMHTRCAECGFALDGCEFDDDDLAEHRKYERVSAQ